MVILLDEGERPGTIIIYFNKSATKFYFHSVKQLLELREFDKKKKHHFYLSRRNKTTNDRFDKVIKEALSIEMEKTAISGGDCKEFRIP